MAKAILFDMDGVLVDSEPLLCKAVIKAFEKQGVELTEAQYYSHWTRSGKNITHFIEENGVRIDKNRYRMDRKEAYHSSLNSVAPLNGVMEKLEEISKDYKLALVSSSSRVDITRVLEVTCLRRYFPLIVSCEDVERAKPAPDGFLFAAKHLGMQPNECIVIEDAEKGVIAAKSAGMKVIAIPNQCTATNDFSEANYVAIGICELSRSLIESL